MKPKTVPLSLRLSMEMNERLEVCAEKTRQKKHSLAQEAIEAAVKAIEANDYTLVVPIKFDVTHVAVEKGGRQNSYPSRSSSDLTFNETPPLGKKSKAA